MNAPLTLRNTRRLTNSLSELKAKARLLLATEMAGAVGAAVRDSLVAALVDRLVPAVRGVPACTPRTRPRTPNRDRDERDAWADYETDEFDERVCPSPSRAPVAADEPLAVPVTAIVAAGINAGRWWLAKHGSAAGAVGLGALTAALGLAGGSVARAALAVTADLLIAEAALDRS